MNRHPLFVVLPFVPETSILGPIDFGDATTLPGVKRDLEYPPAGPPRETVDRAAGDDERGEASKPCNSRRGSVRGFGG